MTAIPIKDTARAVATSNITLSGTQTVDTVALIAGNRCLVVGQTTAANNGLYFVSAGAWTRAYDASSSGIMAAGHLVTVTEGSAANRGSVWLNTNVGAIVLGTTALTYTRVSPDYLSADPWSPGLLGENQRRNEASGTFVQVSGTLYLYGGFVLKAGITYSAVNFYFATAGSALTHSWGGIVALSAVGPYSARQLLAVSADNTAAPGANTFRAFSFGSAFTPTVDVPVYAALLLAATTTVPTIAASPAVTNLALLGQAPIKAGTSNTGLTTPQAANTVENAATAIAQLAYAYLT